MIVAAALHKKTQLGDLTFSMPPPARHSDIISALNGLQIDVHECEQCFVDAKVAAKALALEAKP
jgi:hypothetical protein